MNSFIFQTVQNQQDVYKVVHITTAHYFERIVHYISLECLSKDLPTELKIPNK